MKKFYMILMVVVMLFAINTTAYARDPIISPEGDSTTEVEEESSPKTSDLSILTIGMTTVALAATGVVASKKAKK